jgi:hypothetical protein
MGSRWRRPTWRARDLSYTLINIRSSLAATRHGGYVLSGGKRCTAFAAAHLRATKKNNLPLTSSGGYFAIKQ